jgi:hypothetical protein
MTTITDALPVFEAHEEWKRARALFESMYAWANDAQEQIEMCVKVEGILDDVDDALMTRVLRRRGWYLIPNASYPTSRRTSTRSTPRSPRTCARTRPRSPPPRPPTVSAVARSSRPSAPPSPPRLRARSRRARPCARVAARETLMCVFD